MNRRFDDPFRDHDARLERMRRSRRRLTFVVYLFYAVTICAGAWSLFHPEAIGSFLGRVALGFEEGSR